MKLKYYLRGMGIGIILTAIVMGFALGGRKATISDAEVIERAKTLGMVDPNSGVLSQTNSGADNYEESNQTASGETLGQAREEISEEIDEELASASEDVSGLDEKAQESKDASKTSLGAAGDSKQDASQTESKPGRSPEGLASSQKADETEVSEELEGMDDEESEGMNDEDLEEALLQARIEAETKALMEKMEQEEAADTKKTSEDSNKTNANTEIASNKNPENSSASASASSQHVTTGTTKTVTIPGGMSSDAVAILLFNQGVVDSAHSFNQYLIDRRMDRIIRSGVKTIPAGATYEDIANIICKQ